jgi:2-oxopent-4-enoate/cis-2-oxohex-4-enoate hydratase
LTDSASRERIDRWADALYQAVVDGVQIPGPSGQFGELSLHDAYEVQARVVAKRVAAGERQVGWKVGATSFAILEQMKGLIDGPSYGCLMSGTTWSDPEYIRASDFHGIGLEPEIGVVLDRPLRGPGITNVDVLAACSGVVAAVEILDGRIQRGTGGLADGPADNAFHGGSVLGTRMVSARDFDFLHEGAIVRKNGRLFGSACGVEALGNPLSVVSWLANELAGHDRQIEAGHVVSTGSLLKILPAEAGDVIEMSFANLGSVSFAIVGGDAAPAERAP